MRKEKEIENGSVFVVDHIRCSRLTAFSRELVQVLIYAFLKLSNRTPLVLKLTKKDIENIASDG